MQLLSQQIDYSQVSSKLIRQTTCLCSVVEKVGPRYLQREKERRGSRKTSGSEVQRRVSPDTVFLKFEAVWSTMESWFQLFEQEISSFRSLRERAVEEKVIEDVKTPETESKAAEKEQPPNHLSVSPNLGEIQDKGHLLQVN